MSGPNKLAQFEQIVLPHWEAAYNLARWLMDQDQDAEDVVQEAYLRAFKFFESFHGQDGRAWLLTIVRNTAYSWLRRNRGHEFDAAFDDDLNVADSAAPTSEGLLGQIADHMLLREALETLPVAFREVIILHELEGLSYKEIALIADVPLGTVMSRLARARKRLHQCLAERLDKEMQREL